MLDIAHAEHLFKHWSENSLDIAEHMSTLRRYAEQCESVTEFGTRYIVSTWAFVVAKPNYLTCIDIYPPEYYGASKINLAEICNNLGIHFEFVEGSTLEIEIENTDLLFIDTLHTYIQLSRELNRHHRDVNKWIIIHDTESCKDEMLPAIENFLADNKNWQLKEKYTNNNGLVILERHNTPSS